MEILGMVFLVAVIVMSVVIHTGDARRRGRPAGRPDCPITGASDAQPHPAPRPLRLDNSAHLNGALPRGFFSDGQSRSPYNPYNLRRAPLWGEAIVAAAGPASNLALALIFGLLIRLQLFPDMIGMFMYVVAINVSLAVLNLIPIPPLDGSKIVSAILPRALSRGYDQLRTRMEYNPLSRLRPHPRPHYCIRRRVWEPRVQYRTDDSGGVIFPHFPVPKTGKKLWTKTKNVQQFKDYL